METKYPYLLFKARKAYNALIERREKINVKLNSSVFELYFYIVIFLTALYSALTFSSFIFICNVVLFPVLIHKIVKVKENKAHYKFLTTKLEMTQKTIKKLEQEK